MKQNGYASAEYLTIVAIVGVVMAGLVTLRPREVGPRPPVDAISPIVRLLGHPAEALKEHKPRPPSTGPPRPRRAPRPRPAKPGPVIVPLPEWWGR